MRNNRNKKPKKNFIKFYPGELVEIKHAGHYTLWDTWARQNGYAIPPIRNINAKTIGKFVKTSPENGPLYKIIDIEGELFEIIHASLQKTLNKNNRV
jgi:hypothetical protein